MILLIDNYDSFVYNLARYVNVLGHETVVFRHDEISLEDVKELAPEKIIISPGPCDPSHAGISLELVKCFGHKIPILGVCLGHQVIGQAYGGHVVKALRPMHGKKSAIVHSETGIFHEVNNPLIVGRYHSLVIEKTTLPDCLRIIAETDEGEIMAVQHKTHPVYGVQFHPESVMTDEGMALLKNFVSLRWVASRAATCSLHLLEL